MALLRPATRSEIKALTAETHPLWGGGLTREDYLGLWNDLSATGWGREYARYLVWADEGGEILSSLKLYRPRVRFLGSESRAAVAGAVFTPTDRRRQGHATEMFRAVVREARGRGDEPALLFSDVGTRFYARMGFQPLPASECWARLPRKVEQVPDGYEVRPAGAEDMAAVHEARESMMAGAGLAMIRDLGHWEFLLDRSRNFFRRLGSDSLAHRFRVVLRREEFAGYLVTVEGEGFWNLRESGAADGRAATVAEILRVASCEAAASNLLRVHGWLEPAVMDLLPDWRPVRDRRTKAIPMILPLQGNPDLSGLHEDDAVRLTFMDQF